MQLVNSFIITAALRANYQKDMRMDTEKESTQLSRWNTLDNAEHHDPAKLTDWAKALYNCHYC